jgi:ABC-type uncharacterized transport system permease subunit
MAAVLPTMIMAAVFILVAMAFFLSIGKPPLSTLTDMVMFAVGDTYSLSETLVKTAPILLCAFVVAWLSRHNAFVAIMVSFLIGGLIAAGDSLQLYAKVPAASAIILHGLLFATALAVGGLSPRWRASHG